MLVSHAQLRPRPGTTPAGRPVLGGPSSVSTDYSRAITAALVTTLTAVGLCGLVWLYAVSSRPDANDRRVLSAMLVAPAIYFAFANSSLLLDHFLLVVVVNRLLRRLLDWGEGNYDTLPLLSLVPMFVACLMLLNVFQNWRHMPLAMRRASHLLAAGMAYGLAVGIANNGLPAIYACGEYVTPLIVLYYCVSLRPSEVMVRRWLTTLVTLGVLCAGYGIFQWFDVPPWDAAWLVWSGMYSSQGQATAFGMSVMSTLESRGPASYFFAAVVATLVGLPFFRRAGGVVLAVPPLVAILLTTARTGLIFLAIAMVAMAILLRGRAGVKVLIAVLVLGMLATLTLSRRAESERIFDRVATLSDLSEDGSATGRVDIAKAGFSVLLSNPQGFGFGSGGTAAKIGVSNADAVGDNGYLEVFTTLGVPGACFYFGGLLLVARRAFANLGPTTMARDPQTALGRAMLIGIAPVLLVFNCLAGSHASYVWLLLSRRLTRPPAAVPLSR